MVVSTTVSHAPFLERSDGQWYQQQPSVFFEHGVRIAAESLGAPGWSLSVDLMDSLPYSKDLAQRVDEWQHTLDCIVEHRQDALPFNSTTYPKCCSNGFCETDPDYGETAAVRAL